MFYWLYYVQDHLVSSFYERPLVIWLQGGPGGSSSGFGNFEELGPLFVNGTQRSSSWAKHVNLLFIDNPVGAGFSYVDDLSLLTVNNNEIGRDVIAFLVSFIKIFPKFEKVPLYIYCESYGGKMTVEIAKQLLEAIEQNKIKINFKGIGLGDSWISPVDSVKTWGPFLYQTGMIDEGALERINAGAKSVEKAVNDGFFKTATDLWASLEMDILYETNNIDFYNILYKVKLDNSFTKNYLRNSELDPRFEEDNLQKLMEGPVKKALGIPSKIVHGRQSGAVFKYLKDDFMKPVIHVVEDLLNSTDLQIVIFTGNLDLIVDTPGTLQWIEKLNWNGASEWKEAARKPIIINGYVEGYVKHARTLTLYWVHRSGHMVPTDNPEAALEILRRATEFDEKNANSL